MNIVAKSFLALWFLLPVIDAAPYYDVAGAGEDQAYLEIAIRFFENNYPSLFNTKISDDIKSIRARYFLDSASLTQMYLYENYGWTKCIEIEVIIKEESAYMETVCHKSGGAHYIFYLGNGKIPGIRIAKGLKNCREETDTFIKIKGMKAAMPWL